ncbi:MAG TPA: hypothetical protein VGL38_13475 [bacterium]|jgi:hypothetical protein
MKIRQSVFGILVLLAVSSLAFGQQSMVFVSYFSQDSTEALGCGCTPETRVPFPDSTRLCVVWDVNHATNPGPDTGDLLPIRGQGYGQTNFRTTIFNGAESGLGAGFFVFDPALVIAHPVAADSSWYYLQICGSSCSWHSASFQALAGPNEIELTSADWTCAETTCSGYSDYDSTEIPNNNFEQDTVHTVAWGVPPDLTLYPNPATNQLTLRWRSTCASSYKVYSSSSPYGSYTTLIGTTSDTTLTITQPTDAKQFYSVVSYMDWDQVGVDHNRGVSFMDSRLVTEYDSTTWTEAAVYDSARKYALDFLRDSTHADHETARLAVAEIVNYHDATHERVIEVIDSLATLGVVSSREVPYLYRLFELVFEDTALTDVEFNDSLNIYVDDVTAVSWNDGEFVCLTMASVGSHSWDYRNTGYRFNFGNSLDNHEPPNWRWLVERDLVGAGLWLLRYGQSGAWVTGGWVGGVVWGLAGGIITSDAAWVEWSLTHNHM